MPHVVRLSDPRAVDDLIETLRSADAQVRRRGAGTILVADNDDDLEAELLFFLRAWALSRPTLKFELDRL